MEIIVYVGFKTQIVISEEKYNKQLEERKQEWQEDETAFNDWLGNNYLVSDVWNATPKDREDIWSRWLEFAEEEAKTEFDYENGWKRTIIEI